MTTVITFGTYDVFHVGHLLLLERAAALGDRLVVGVSTDALNMAKKGRNPVYPEDQRVALVAALRCVHSVFLEHSLELKADYIREHSADVLVMGDDWEGKFDFLAPLCRVVYLPRTPSVSTTALIEKIRG
jgi:glycerol-3-phosphate cytidylyltransferase